MAFISIKLPSRKAIPPRMTEGAKFLLQTVIAGKDSSADMSEKPLTSRDDAGEQVFACIP